ncbi:MAG TPA: hypothetical protein VGP48_12430 [Stellaceae bacterium]|jgi:hypothetical protein|nr:hypothetical protein [Stellaceae bacterium]
MITRSSTTALFCASLFAAMATLPIAAALAADAPTQTAAAPAMMTAPTSSGVYDQLDSHRDAKGFPAAGWEYLFSPPS